MNILAESTGDHINSSQVLDALREDTCEPAVELVAMPERATV